MAEAAARFFFLRNVSLAWLLFAIHLLLCHGFIISEPNSWSRSSVKPVINRACIGGIGGECLWKEEMEMAMDSEINRRLLATQKKYISYGSLRRDEIPCSRPGASCYNCHGLGKANPYRRGCEVITGGARDN